MKKNIIRWNEYTKPRDALSGAIQYPLDENWASRVMNAYLKETGTLKALKRVRYV